MGGAAITQFPRKIPEKLARPASTLSTLLVRLIATLEETSTLMSKVIATPVGSMTTLSPM